MTTRETIVALARETGHVPTLSSMPYLEAFYLAAYAAGMEEAAKVCDDLEKQKWESIGNALHVGGQLIFTSPIHCAAAIREKAAEVTK